MGVTSTFGAPCGGEPASTPPPGKSFHAGARIRCGIESAGTYTLYTKQAPAATHVTRPASFERASLALARRTTRRPVRHRACACEVRDGDTTRSHAPRRSHAAR